MNFKTTLTRAETLMKLCPHDAYYWRGFLRGARRGHHGADFGTAEEHAKWMRAHRRQDESTRQSGLGYLDGYLCFVRWERTPGVYGLRAWVSAHGMKSADLEAVCGVNERTARYWQAKGPRNMPLSCWRLLLTRRFCA